MTATAKVLISIRAVTGIGAVGLVAEYFHLRRHALLPEWES